MTSKTERDRFQELRILNDEGSESNAQISGLAKLEQLLDALKRGSSIRFSGSPASVVFGIFSDILALSSELFLKKNKLNFPAKNPGLKFVESLRVPEGNPKFSRRYPPIGRELMDKVGHKGPSYLHQTHLQEKGISSDDHIFVESISTTVGKDYDKDVQYDPLTGEEYFYASDALGNPLQISIDFDTPNISFNARDRSTLINFFADLDQLFVLLSSGRIDYRLVRGIHRLMTRQVSNNAATQPSTDKTHKKQHSGYFYRKRKQQGLPKGDKR